jgi:hypothetical protein
MIRPDPVNHVLIQKELSRAHSVTFEEFIPEPIRKIFEIEW